MNKMLHTKAVIDKANVSEAGVIHGIIASSNVVDRMGDIIDQAGWNLKNFNQNPVILWGHNVVEEKLPIGKAIKTWVEGKGTKSAKLMLDVQFDLQDDFAAQVFRKIKDGFLNTVSVGFMPDEWEELDPGNWFGGLKYLNQELLEVSVVPVPANPEAIMPMRSFAEKDKRFTPVEEKEIFPQVKDNRDKKLAKDSKAVTLEQVQEQKEDTYVHELRSVDEFDPDSFKAFSLHKSDKRTWTVVVGQLKDSEAIVEQSVRALKGQFKDEEEFKAETIPAPSGMMDETGNANSQEDQTTNEAGSYTDETKLVDLTAGDLEDILKEVMGAIEEAEKENQPQTGQEGVKAMSTTMDKPPSGMGCKEMTVGHFKALTEDNLGDWFSNLDTTSNQDVNNYSFEGEEKENQEKAKKMLEAIVKSGRVLSSKNENKVRQAMDLLDQVLEALDKEEVEPTDQTEMAAAKDAEEEEISKKAIPYKNLGTLPESETWDGPGEVAKASVEDLQLMCAWVDEQKPEEKSSYKLVHHKADGDHKAVWRGVAASMGALLGAKGSDIPEEDKKAVYNHLVKHYEEFGKDIPDFKAVEDQVLAHYEEEIQAIVLDREDKHAVKLLKRILDNQAKEIKPTDYSPTDTQTKHALEILASALSKVEKMRGGENYKS